MEVNQGAQVNRNYHLLIALISSTKIDFKTVQDLDLHFPI